MVRTSSPIILNKIFNLQNINALIPHQELTFCPKLTAIFGETGSGKSGYARILGCAGFTRGDKDVLPNIARPWDDETIRSADIEVLKDNSTKVINYKVGDRCDELSQCYVFDSTSVHVHLTGSNAFSFSPAGLIILTKLAEATDKVRQLLQEKIDTYRKPHDFGDLFQGITEVTDFIQTIGPNTKLEELMNLASLSVEENKRISQLDFEISTLKTRDVPKQVNRLNQTVTDLEKLVKQLGEIEAYLNSKAINDLNNAIQQYLKRESLSQNMSIDQFKSEYFSQIGSESWRNFIFSAKTLADSESSPDSQYPRVNDLCLLCRQPLDTDSRNLLLSIWKYLEAYLRYRLVVARDLLTETGSVFVQIGDENVHLVRSLMDEVFGSENFASLITAQKTTGAGSPSIGTNVLASVSDYIIWYAKDLEKIKFRQLYLPKGIEQGFIPSAYNRLELADGSRRTATAEEKKGDIPEGAKLYSLDNLTSQAGGESARFPIEFGGKVHRIDKGSWKTNLEGIKNLIAARRIEATENRLGYVRYLDDFPAVPNNNMWTDVVSSFLSEKVYVVQTNSKIIERCLLMTTDPGDLVLDPTCGSGTTAYVAELWGRRWVTIDTSRVALALARTRLMAARYPYYIMADSQEGIKKETELSGRTPPDYKTGEDIKKGFVYKRVPHITLKSIANNSDTREGMTKKEIDVAIARYAETETLYGQPYEDNKRIRVTGPLTVESLSPHRIIAVEDERPTAEIEAQKETSAGQFESMILDNLKKAGVQNTVKNERLKFDRLDPYAGEWLHAEGEYTEKDGTTRRVAVCIGPEHGTVGPDLVKDAAKEAVKGVSFDLLVICGFAFDPHVSEEAKRYGKLNILITRMNPDLVMGDALLKTTGAGNLFMVFGEPDVDIRKQKDGKVVVEIKGVDVYDPTTGQIRNSSTDDIACWFIDTDYNEESFFVRHAYFTGAEEPYEKLKRVLKAEIDEAAWSSLYSTVSRPFDPPNTGKIAIKVINHYGDEVLKVYEVD